jgi:hypothetical protein
VRIFFCLALKPCPAFLHEVAIIVRDLNFVGIWLGCWFLGFISHSNLVVLAVLLLGFCLFRFLWFRLLLLLVVVGLLGWWRRFWLRFWFWL